jgi:hypothetical protein
MVPKILKTQLEKIRLNMSKFMDSKPKRDFELIGQSIKEQ